MASGLLLFASGGQAVLAQTSDLRTIDSQFKSEEGCPVKVVSSKTDLEIDPIGTAMACRIYIDYQNISNKSLSGVKFRIGYVDSEEKIRGSFHAPDGHIVEPGGVAKAKWRGEKVDPRTARVMIRVLVARYSDGSTWESEKMRELAPGTGGAGPSSAGTAGSAAAAGGAGSAGTAGSAGSAGASAGDAGSGTNDSAPGTATTGSPSAAGSATPADAGTPAGSSVPAVPDAGSRNTSDGY